MGVNFGHFVYFSAAAANTFPGRPPDASFGQGCIPLLCWFQDLDSKVK